MIIAKSGDWVRIGGVVLPAGERAPQVPPETQAVPLLMMMNGFLQNDEAAIGDTVRITTLAERTVEGELLEKNPRYRHDFGDPQPELLTVGPKLRKLLKGNGKSEGEVEKRNGKTKTENER
jgi:hypothetical protein